MSTLTLTKLKTKEELSSALEAFKFIKSLSEGELETLEILSSKNDKDFFLNSLEESKNNKISSINSIL